MSQSEPLPEPEVPVLEVRDARVDFAARQGLWSRGSGGTAKAVDGVDLAIARGEIVALAGESGCGKTTLARTIMGRSEEHTSELQSLS